MRNRTIGVRDHGHSYGTGKGCVLPNVTSAGLHDFTE
jgi:hypothetical protein